MTVRLSLSYPFVVTSLRYFLSLVPSTLSLSLFHLNFSRILSLHVSLFSLHIYSLFAPYLSTCRVTSVSSSCHSSFFPNIRASAFVSSLTSFFCIFVRLLWSCLVSSLTIISSLGLGGKEEKEGSRSRSSPTSRKAGGGRASRKLKRVEVATSFWLQQISSSPSLPTFSDLRPTSPCPSSMENSTLLNSQAVWEKMETQGKPPRGGAETTEMERCHF